MSNPVTITRTFNATPDRVWQMWTQADLLNQWWKPENGEVEWKTDATVGSSYLYRMRGPMGANGEMMDMWGKGTYKELVPGKKIVMTDSFADAEGNTVTMPGWPTELLITVTFEDEGGGKTRMTLVHEGLPEGKDGELAVQGWNNTLKNLDKIL